VGRALARRLVFHPLSPLAWRGLLVAIAKLGARLVGLLPLDDDLVELQTIRVHDGLAEADQPAVTGEEANAEIVHLAMKLGFSHRSVVVQDGHDFLDQLLAHIAFPRGRRRQVSALPSIISLLLDRERVPQMFESLVGRDCARAPQERKAKNEDEGEGEA